MQLIDCRNGEQGAMEDEIRMITSEIKCACRKSKNQFLRDAVTEQDWAGIRKLKGFPAQQARIEDRNGTVKLAGPRTRH